MSLPKNMSLCVSAGLLVAIAGGMTAAVACPEHDKAPACDEIAPTPPAAQGEILHVSAPHAPHAPTVIHAVHTPETGMHVHTPHAPHAPHAASAPHGIHQTSASSGRGQNQTSTWTFDDDESGSTQKIVYVTSSDDGKYEVRVEGPDVEVKHNGKVIARELVEINDGVVVIHDGRGDAIKQFVVAPKGGALVRRSGARGGAGQGIAWDSDADIKVFAPNDAKFGWASSGETPPVMVGIHQTEISDALRWHLRLKDTPAILVERVIDGLPADEAGVRQYDVIISIDGSEGASGNVLTKVLREKEAGDDLEMYVISRGDKKKVTLELAPYDGKRLGASNSQGLFEAAPGQRQALRFGDGAWTMDLDGLADLEGSFDIDVEELHEKIRKQYEEMHSAYEKKGLSLEQRERAEAESHKALAMLNERMHEHVAKAEERARAAAERALELRGNRLVFPEHLSNRWEGAGEDLEARLGDLEGRLDELNAVIEDRMDMMMDRLARMMDELEESIEERDED
ncbi:MAG: hypothetical protein DHS20C14_15680 [Phycisphaeraceae bacterium]|nr:MAG: hypothetical protein DHS20C14_15680 [Phycisphaeraceae bacterium]